MNRFISHILILISVALTACSNTDRADAEKIQKTQQYLQDEVAKRADLPDSNPLLIEIYNQLLDDLSAFGSQGFKSQPTLRYAIFNDGLLIHWIGESAGANQVLIIYGQDEKTLSMPLSEIDRETNALNSQELYLGSAFFSFKNNPELSEKAKLIKSIELQH